MEEHKPAEVKVVLKRGDWHIEITCPEDRVDKVVEAVLSGFALVEHRRATAPTPEAAPRREPRRITLKQILQQLWKEGWFSTFRVLGEVAQEMAKRGYHYDSTAISHTLTDLVRDGFLTREGQPGMYRYVQKKPPL